MSSEVRELVSAAHRLRQQGLFAEAKSAAERALQIDPENASAWFNVGAALGGLADFAGAEAAYRRALSGHPAYAEAWSNLGGVLDATGRPDEALAAYRKALEANPNLAPIWSNLGNALCSARRHAEAEAACRRAIELEPHFVAGWLNLGRVLQELKRPAEAHDACQRALALAPQLAAAWAGLANALVALREFTAAIDAYRRAISLRPQDPDFHANLGVAQHRIGLESEGLASVRRALELAPSHAFASWNLGLWLLQDGELAEGWARYEWRWAHPDAPARRFPPKGGAPFAGRVLVWAEQGIGDHVLYAGMAAELAQSGASVTLETDVRLVALFRRSFSQLTIVPQTDPPHVDPAQFDHVVPLASLGGLLRNSFEVFPRHPGYLRVDKARSARYRQVLGEIEPRNRLVVGIAWRSKNPELADEKSAPLQAWAPLLATPGVTFVSLQYGDVAAERREAEQRIGVHISTVPGLDVFGDLDGLAAAQAACDLVITTSTVNAHLAGAAGQPAWVLLPRHFGGLWYWFVDRDDSPWYPSLLLIRQAQDGDWSAAMAVAARKLREQLTRAS